MKYSAQGEQPTNCPLYQQKGEEFRCNVLNQRCYINDWKDCPIAKKSIEKILALLSEDVKLDPYACSS